MIHSSQQEVDIEATAVPWNFDTSSTTKVKSAPAPYLRGPIPWPWLQVAASLGSGALATGLAVWHLKALNKSSKFRASLNQLRKWTGLSQKVTRDGLHRLEEAGLVLVDRPKGRSPTITLVTSDYRKPPRRINLD